MQNREKIMRLFKYLMIAAFVGLIVQYFYFPYPWRRTQKIAVIGGGLAGLSASITAVNEGQGKTIVLLFDKEKNFGGNSAKATSGINGVYTPAQITQNIEDSYEKFYEDTIKSGKGQSDGKLARTLVEESTSAVSFLSSFGVDLGTLSQCGGHSAKRTHRSDPEKIKYNIGGHIIQNLKDAVASMRNIRGHLMSTVIEVRRRGLKKYEVLVEENGVVKIHIVDKVILTSGGFGADSDGLLRIHRPEFASFPTTNGPGSTGDGIKLGEGLGAKVVDLTEVQVHPTGFLSKEMAKEKKVFLAPEALRGSGGLLFKKPGVRFVDELGTRDFVTDRILNEGVDKFGSNRIVATLILNQKSAELFGKSKIGFYESKKLVKVYDNFKDLCDGEEGFEYEKLKKSIEKYTQEMENEGKDEFGKTVYPAEYNINDGPVYRMFVTPSIHYTMGGILINSDAEVLDVNGEVIPNLYAAGEVTGGVHGRNRLAGNSLLECTVFGRIAGKKAVN